MATIKDIAQMTGVSPTTVSNVINGKGGRVSAETISRINEVIKQLGYVPNMSARSLVNNSSKVVALINHSVLGQGTNFMEDPFHSSFIGILEENLRRHGYYLMIRTVADSEELLTFIRNWNVDGMFIIGIFKDAFFQTLTTLHLPVVLIDSYVKHPNICNIGLEDYQGSYQATKHLIECGHRHIAFISPNIVPGGVLHERLLGYYAALNDAGITPNDAYVFESANTFESYAKLAQTITSMPQLTGLVTTADIIAAGLLKSLLSLGKRVPEDYSIVGFDDLNISRLVTPALTTIHQDMYLKGQYAVDTMIECLNGLVSQKKEVILPTELICRDSVKKL